MKKRSVKKSSRFDGQFNKSYLYCLIVFIAIVFLDQVTKYFVKASAVNKDWGWLAFTYTTNTGAGFGLFKDFGSLLLWLSVIVFGIIIYYLPSMDGRTRFASIFVLAGIVGNVIDRIVHGFVIDFINLKWWPVFNVADSAISLGVVGLIIFMWKK